MRRFVICLDGTWNNASREVEKGSSRVYRPTNVLKIARATHARGKDGVEQITYYDPGVGSMNRAPDVRARVMKRVDNVLGGGWGVGFEANIEEAYTFLSNNFESGDEIFIFGFSRGAAQAQSLCRLISWGGGFPAKKDAYYVPTFFTDYLAQRGEQSIDGSLQKINQRRKERGESELVSITRARVKFLGVWDTVLSLGWRIKARSGTTRHALAFHTSKQPPKLVDTIRHALAIDEQRHDFQPEIWEPADCVEQRWFAGAHSNIGGGLIDDSLANCALRWICDEAVKQGLSLGKDFLSYYRENPGGSVQLKARLYRVIDTILRPVRGFNGVRELLDGGGTLDSSVIMRLQALRGRYMPGNLIRYLTNVTDHDHELPEDLLTELVQRRES